MFDINNLQVLSNISAAKLENAINKIRQDNKLKGLGPAFLEAEKKYNINAVILASIACLESAYGTSKLAMEKNNLFGIDAPLSAINTDKYGKAFTNKAICIDHAGHRLGKQYLELDEKAKWRYCKGNKDIYSVGSKWCEVEGWAVKVISIANRIKNNMNNSEGKSMKIAITVGHSILKNGTCTSAGGYVQEYKYCKELAPLIANYLKQEKHTVDVIVCPERQFNKAYKEKTYKLSKVNKRGYDLLVELHLNAFNGSAKGTEVLYFSDRGKPYAQRVNDKLDDIFTDRHIKKRTDLYILRDTDCSAILVEAFFCDNKEDYQKADEAHEKDLIARKIAEGIINKPISETPSKPNVEVNKEIWYRAVSGSFKDIHKANQRMSDLKVNGFSGVFLDNYVKDGVTYKRVVAGSFKNKSNAEQRVKEMKVKGFDGGFVVTFKN